MSIGTNKFLMGQKKTIPYMESMDKLDFSKLTENELIALLSTQKQPAGLIQTISGNEHLELIGKLLTTEQILSLLSQYPGKSLHEKIAPIFVGMSQERFEELLLKSSDKQMQVLKLEGFSEAITHHLTLFIHHLEEQYVLFFKTLTSIESDINGLDLESASKRDIAALNHRLKACLEDVSTALEKVKKALAIVWSTSNIELIEKLNKVNNSLERMRGGSELRDLLTQKIFSIYADLKEDDPAIDGLANMSIWYLEDYVSVGLLPSDADRSEENRKNLFITVKERLQRANLRTVKDLKEAYIFSRQTLKDYLDIK